MLFVADHVMVELVPGKMKDGLAERDTVGAAAGGEEGVSAPPHEARPSVVNSAAKKIPERVLDMTDLLFIMVAPLQ